jgi:hypothetical protein
MQFYALKNKAGQYYSRVKMREQYTRDLLDAQIYHNREQARIVATTYNLKLFKI